MRRSLQAQVRGKQLRVLEAAAAGLRDPPKPRTLYGLYGLHALVLRGCYGRDFQGDRTDCRLQDLMGLSTARDLWDLFTLAL